MGYNGIRGIPQEAVDARDVGKPVRDLMAKNDAYLDRWRNGRDGRENFVCHRRASYKTILHSVFYDRERKARNVRVTGLIRRSESCMISIRQRGGKGIPNGRSARRAVPSGTLAHSNTLASIFYCGHSSCKFPRILRQCNPRATTTTTTTTTPMTMSSRARDETFIAPRSPSSSSAGHNRSRERERERNLLRSY